MVRSNIVLIVLIALMCSMFFMMGSSAADAQTLPYQDMALENNEYDYQDLDLEEYGPSVYDKFFFQQLAAVLNLTTPYKAGYGIEVSSVTMDGNSIHLSVNCDYLVCLYFDLTDDDSAEAIKFEQALLLYDYFDAMGCDNNGDSILSKMEAMGVEFNYHFYVDELHDAIMSFTITGDYITRAVENSNGIYTI